MALIEIDGVILGVILGVTDGVALIDILGVGLTDGVADGVLLTDIVGVGVDVTVGVTDIVGVTVGDGGGNSTIPISNSHSGSVTFTVILPVPLRKGAQ